MNQIIDNSHTKTLFQDISTQLETLLLQYKGQYPKNFGQIVRKNLAISVFVFCLFLGVGCFMSMNEIAAIFSISVVPGFVIFTVMLFVIDSRYKPDYRKYVAEIEQLRSRLAPLTAYPDVRNYYNSFSQRVLATTKYKEQIKKKYNRVTNICLAIGIVILIIMAVPFVKKDGQQFKEWHDAPEVNPDVYVYEEHTICELTPLVNDESDPSPKKVTINVGSDNSSMSSYGLSKLVADSSMYALFITDTIGNPVPRAPVFVFNALDGSYVSATTRTSSNLEQTRLRKYLRDHAHNLRYKVESLPITGIR